MKIGVITLHKVRNYGSVLQTYATQEVLSGLGYEASIIDYCSYRFQEKNRLSDEYSRFKFKYKNGLVHLAFNAMLSPSLWLQRKIFDSFLEERLTLTRSYSSIEELEENPPEADVYCTGSDQVWNIKTNGYVERPFYLDFGPVDKPRFAFSASFGRPKLDEDEALEIGLYLSRYTGIGVREKSSLAILKDLGVQHFENTLDPTLVLAPSEWIKLTPVERPYNHKYILIYEFNKSSGIAEYARKLSQITGYPIYRITYWYHERHHGEKCIVVPSVYEFLQLIRHAEYVLTNSFHATVFSTVFRVKFATIYPKAFSVRLEDYLLLVGLSDRHLNSIDKIERINKPIDYDRVHEKLAFERERTLTFVRDTLQSIG